MNYPTEISFQRIRNSEVFKNTSLLVSGTALAQLIPILLQPLLRRQFSPDAFGAYAIYLSLLGILTVVSSFKYEQAIVLPEDDNESIHLVFGSQLINLTFNVLLLLVIFIFQQSILSLINLPYTFRIYIYLVPAGTFLFNLYQALNFWLIRKKAFMSLSVNKFARRGSEGGVQISSRFLGIPNGLVLGDVFGHIVNVIAGFIQCKRKAFNLKTFTWKTVQQVFQKYIEFPKYNLIPGLMSACSFLLPALFIARFYSTEYVGFFDLSKMLLSIPMALVASSVSNVLLERYSSKFNKKESIQSELLGILGLILLLAVAEIVIVLLFGEQLFSICFGKDWVFSGEISRILVWSYVLNFVVACFSSLFISLRRIKVLSIWQLGYFILILSLVIFKNVDFIRFIKIYVLIEVVCYAVYFILIVMAVRSYEINLSNGEN